MSQKSPDATQHRKRLLELADDLYASVITHRQFHDALPAEVFADPDLDEVIDMIMHEPHIGWFLGVSKEQGRKNRAKIIRLLDELRQPKMS